MYCILLSRHWQADFVFLRGTCNPFGTVALAAARHRPHISAYNFYKICVVYAKSCAWCVTMININYFYYTVKY